MAKSKKNKHKDLSHAWEARKTYYDYNGIRDCRTGWTKRLGITPTAFGQRLALYKKGQINKEQLFRINEPGHKTNTKYEIKSPEEFRKSRMIGIIKRLESHERAPKLHTIRVWETVFQALKKINHSKTWNKFFIEKLKLDVPIPKGL